jgi:hypothetical protein
VAPDYFHPVFRGHHDFLSHLLLLPWMLLLQRSVRYTINQFNISPLRLMIRFSFRNKNRKKMGRFGGGVRPVMVVDGRSGQASDLTTPGEYKFKWKTYLHIHLLIQL